MSWRLIRGLRLGFTAALVASTFTLAMGSSIPVAGHAPSLIPAGGELRVAVPEAIGGKTVIGQLAVDRATDAGFVTAYGCDNGLPRDRTGRITRADLNFDGRITPVQSNRLIVEADDDGDICFHTVRRVAMIVDINGVADSGIASFSNRRTDTRDATNEPVASGAVFVLDVPEATGAKTVIGQLAVDGATTAGYVSSYGCADGLPQTPSGAIARADLNFDGRITPVQSNRLVVQADGAGAICFYVSEDVELIIDLNAVSDTGITSFTNRRIDTRRGDDPNEPEPPPPGGVPEWPPFVPGPRTDDVAALTGRPASPAVRNRPIVAVKIDNFRRARPQFALDRADAIIEENVEGVTRFVALFHSDLPTGVGPVRSAREGDLDLLSAMNRPILGYSGANPGVTAWIRSAARSGVLVDFSGLNRPCYRREPTRPGPHNLILDPACAVALATSAGPATALWEHDAAWQIPAGFDSTSDRSFSVRMDGVDVDWSWDTANRTYLRSQDNSPHVAEPEIRIDAENVVVLFVEHPPSIIDARSPNPITVGVGRAIVHRDGRAIDAQWSRATPYQPFVFSDPATGAGIPLDVGRTVIELSRS